MRHGYVMAPWLFNLYIYMDAVMEVKMGMGRRGGRFQEERRDWRLPSLLYADDLVFCVRAMVGRFFEVCRGRGHKVKAGKAR